MINGVIPSHCFCGVGPYTRSANPIWSFVDLTGNQFDDTFYMWVLNNQIPYQPATIYQTPTGTPWVGPIRFLANGTLPNNIYWDPNVVYRLEFRHNLGILPPSQADPLIYLVENYAPNGNNAELENVSNLTTTNQISNSQFVEVNFTNPFTLTNVTNPAPIEIAPDWFLTLTGTGNITVNRIPLYFAPGLTNPTNAPYAIEINLTGGWTGNPILSQTLPVNGMLWGGKYVSGSFTGLIQGAAAQVTTRLVASNGPPVAVLNTNILSNAFTEYTSVALLPATMNTDIPPDADIEFQMLLPANGDLYLTSFQLVASNVDTPYEYQQETVSRQIDNLFHYYKPRLEYKPIPSYLVGWDFPVNPAQINGDAIAVQATAVNQGYYAWDQTIIYQTLASSVATARGTNGSLQLTCAIAGQVAIIQYLDQVEARKILSDRASVHLSLFGNLAGGGHGNVTLWATTDATLPALPNTFITTLDADGKPATVSTVNWVQVPNLNQNTRFTVPAISATNAESNDISLNGWDLAGAVPVNTATFFAIVIGFSPWAIADTLNINSVGLCAGDIATRPAPKTQNEVLADCQRYYEKSYSAATLPATITNVNMICKGQGAYLEAGVNYHMVAQSFSIDYKVEKRTANAATTLYNPATVTANQVLGTVFGAGSAAAGTGNINVAGVWTAISNTKAAFYNLTGYNAAVVEGSFAGGGWATGAIRLHYVTDARLGVIN